MGKEFSRLHKIDGLAKYDYCKPADGLLLESDLGLKPIFDMALKPVAEGTLTRGNHPGLASSPPASVAAAQESLDNFTHALSAPPPAVTNLDAFIAAHPANKKQFDLILPSQPLDKAKEIASDVSEAAKIEEDAKNIIANIVTPLFDVASSTVAKKCMSAGKTRPAITADKNNAVVSASLVSFEKVKVDQAQTPSESKAALDKEKKYQKDNIQYATWLIDDMRGCLEHPPTEEVALYDPIDVISETVNFYITSSGSVTPTWKLVRVSAPLNSTFTAVSRKDTNTLIISMGRPDSKGGPSTAMSNQLLSSLLGQAVQNLPGPR